MNRLISKKERNNIIVSEIENNNAKLEDLAKRFNLTKQRVSQIYYDQTEKPHGFIQINRKEVNKQKKEKKLLTEKFKCTGCGKSVNRKNGKGLMKYCSICHKKSSTQRRDINITLRCQYCKRKFHPFRSKRTIRKFCSRSCYFKKIINVKKARKKILNEKMATQREG